MTDRLSPFACALHRRLTRIATVFAVALIASACPTDKTPTGPDPDPDPDPTESLAVALEPVTPIVFGTRSEVGTSGRLTCAMEWTATASGTGTATWDAIEWTVASDAGSPTTETEPASAAGATTASFTAGSQTLAGEWYWTASEGDQPRYRPFTVTVSMTYTQNGAAKETAPITIACAIPEPEITQLENSVQADGLSSPAGYSQLFKVNVPEGSTVLHVVTEGTGDLDLYVRHLEVPTLETHDCAAETETAAELCTIEDPAPGDWYVLAYAWAEFSGVTIMAIAEAEPEVPGFTITGPSSISVPRGEIVNLNVSVTRTGGFDDAITLVVDGLPTGVIAVESAIEAGATTGSIPLAASPDASTVPATVTVYGSGPGVPVSSFTITVTATDGTVPPPPGGGGDVIQLLHSFVYSGGTDMPDGGRPESSPTLGSDGNLYGFTRSGGLPGSGASGQGTVYRLTPAGQLTTIEVFDNYMVDGRNPLGGMAAASDGNLYGLTFDGVFYKITTAGAVTKIVRNAEISGSLGRLIQGQDGNFYGTTGQGGASSKGTVFRITTAGAVTTLATFTGANGAIPSAGLVQAPDGNFYGTTQRGGANDEGTIFRMTPGGALTTIVSFTGGGAGKNGASPRSQLVVGADENLYGTTRLGGTYFSGTIFKVTTSGTLTTLHNFRLLEDWMTCNCGLTDPHGGLVLAGDGNFYGTAVGGMLTGGAFPRGAVYKLTPAGEFSVVGYFSEVPGGIGPENPLDNLTLGPDGNLYGTSHGGGSADIGTVFRVNISGM